MSAERLALGDAIESDVEAAARDTEPAHAVGEPRRSEPDLRVAEAFARLPEHRIVRNEAILEPHLTVSAEHCMI